MNFEEEYFDWCIVEYMVVINNLLVICIGLKF